MTNTFAVIDIGSLKVKFLIASIDTNHNFTEIYSSSVLTCLGCERVEHGGAITSKYADRTYREVRRCMQILKDHNLKTFRVIATEALRKATNSSEVTHNLELITAQSIETISAKEEAELYYKAVMSDMPEDISDHLLVDVGGGSVQLIFGNKNTIKDMALLPTGAQHLHDMFVKEAHDENGKTSLRELESIKAFIRTELVKTAINHKRNNNVPILYGSTNILDLFSFIQLPVTQDGPSHAHPYSTHPRNLETLLIHCFH